MLVDATVAAHEQPQDAQSEDDEDPRGPGGTMFP